MSYLSEDKEHIGFLLNSEPDMGFARTRTLLSGTHKQKAKTKQVQNYNDAITASARAGSCRKVFVQLALRWAGDGQQHQDEDAKKISCINQFTLFGILQ